MNADVIAVLIQGGVIGFVFGILFFGYKWFDRSKLSADKDTASDKKIMMALIEQSNKKTDAMVKESTATREAIERMNKSMDSHQHTSEELHRLLKNMNGKLQGAYVSKVQEMRRRKIGG